MRIRRSICTLLLSWAIAATSAAATEVDSPVGVWRVLDQDDHTPLALVQVYERDAEYLGRVVKTFASEAAPLRCGACRGALHDQPLLGMLILHSLRRSGDHFADGELLDPETGHTYHCVVHVRDHGQTLYLRGYVATVWLGATQIWVREE